MSPVTASYRHSTFTAEPERLSTLEIWAVARAVRGQMAAPLHRRLALDDIAASVARADVNGVLFDIDWDLDHEVLNPAGEPVMGVTEYDRASPECVMVSINGPALCSRKSLALDHRPRAWTRRFRCAVLGDDNPGSVRLLEPGRYSRSQRSRSARAARQRVHGRLAGSASGCARGYAAPREEGSICTLATPLARPSRRARVRCVRTGCGCAGRGCVRARRALWRL
jgi:hypothetical protein